jgi:DNA-binding CsgD family transcriptional regulator
LVYSGFPVLYTAGSHVRESIFPKSRNAAFFDHHKNSNAMGVSKEVNSILHQYIEGFKQLDRWMPGIKIIQRIEPEENLFICQRGKKRFQLSQAFFRHLPQDEFRKLIFDRDCPHTCLIGTSVEEGQRRELYIRYNASHAPSEAELISIQVVVDESTELPSLRVIQLLSSSLVSWVPAKTARIVNEMAFYSVHRKKFQQLTRRNREVLALMAKGMSAEEIGERLFIGVNTVNTHKRRVREILEIKSNYELMQYGLAFNLV